MMAIFCYKYFTFSCDGECSNTVWFTLQLPYDAFLVGPSKVGHVENQFRSMSVVYETRLLVVRVAVQIRWGQSRGLPASFYVVVRRSRFFPIVCVSIHMIQEFLIEILDFGRLSGTPRYHVLAILAL